MLTGSPKCLGTSSLSVRATSPRERSAATPNEISRSSNTNLRRCSFGSRSWATRIETPPSKPDLRLAEAAAKASKRSMWPSFRTVGRPGLAASNAPIRSGSHRVAPIDACKNRLGIYPRRTSAALGRRLQIAAASSDRRRTRSTTVDLELFLSQRQSRESQKVDACRKRTTTGQRDESSGRGYGRAAQASPATALTEA